MISVFLLLLLLEKSFSVFSIIFEGFFSKDAIAKQASASREFNLGLYLKISTHTSASYSSIFPQSLVVSF